MKRKLPRKTKKKKLDELFKVIADEAILGLIAFESETGTCVYANKMACDLLEIPEESHFSVMDLSQLCPDKTHDKLRAFTPDLLNFEGLHQDVLIRQQNGQTFIANVGVKHSRFNDKNHFLIMMQDIGIQKKLQRDLVAKQTAIKSAYEQLLEQNKQLLDLAMAKNRFIAVTTHELRTPLAAMVSSSEVLKMKLYDSPKQMEEFINIIWEQGQHLTALINDILDFAKIQAGKMDFYVHQQDLVPLIAAHLESIQAMADDQSIRLQFINPGETCICYFDELRLRQVFSNIVNNAIKYNRSEGSVTVWIEDKKDHFEVHVKDTGPGIRKEDRVKVFDEFETLGKVALHHKGTGLGMPISQRLMEGMGGKIFLESEFGKGSTFWFTIPKEKVLPEEYYRPRPDSFDLAS